MKRHWKQESAVSVPVQSCPGKPPCRTHPPGAIYSSEPSGTCPFERQARPAPPHNSGGTCNHPLPPPAEPAALAATAAQEGGRRPMMEGEEQPGEAQPQPHGETTQPEAAQQPDADAPPQDDRPTGLPTKRKPGRPALHQGCQVCGRRRRPRPTGPFAAREATPPCLRKHTPFFPCRCAECRWRACAASTRWALRWEGRAGAAMPDWDPTAARILLPPHPRRRTRERNRPTAAPPLPPATALPHLVRGRGRAVVPAPRAACHATPPCAAARRPPHAMWAVRRRAWSGPRSPPTLLLPAPK